MKLLTFGCSLTQHKGLKEKLSELLDAKLINFAVGAGSNGLQIYRFHEYIINNKLDKDDIILWQITVDRRNAIRLEYSPSLNKKFKKIEDDWALEGKYIRHYLTTSTNVFDGLPRYDILSSSPIHDEEQYTHTFDYRQQSETLLANLILISKFHPRLLVFFGWDNILANYDKTFIKIMEENGINFIADKTYLTWVKDNNGTLQDDLHPTEESGKRYATEVLYPKIKDLGWS